MKIAIVLERFDPAVGGLEKATSQLAHALVDAGHQVHVVATAFAAESLTEGMTPHRIEACGSRFDRAAAAERCLRSLNADVIHDTGVGWYFDVFHPHHGSRIADWRQTLRSHRWYRRPLVAMSPSLHRGYRARRLLEDRQLGARRGVIIAVSRMVFSHFRDLHGVSPERMHVIYNGVDVEHYTTEKRAAARAPMRAQLRLARDDVLFLLIAHNPRLKGAAAAIAALAQLPTGRPGACLALVGRGDTRAYERQAAALGVADRCRFIGFVSDPAPYYSAADVYLHPTFYDPCSLAALEAWASGLPVITTSYNGAAELMTPGQQGLLLRQPDDVGALATAMRRLLDARARAAMCAPARALVGAHTTAVHAQDIMDLYASLSARRSNAA